MKRTARGLSLFGLMAALGVGLAWGAGAKGRPPAGVMGPPGEIAYERHSELDAFANTPYRPAWAPLSVLCGQLAIVPFLHELLTSPDPASRARSALLLGQIACPTSAPLLGKRLMDSDRSVRVQSGIALACMGDPRGVSTCEAALRNDAPWVRYYAAFGLWCINTPRARTVLQEGIAGQGKLVSDAIHGALVTPHLAPLPVPALPPKVKVSPRPSPAQIWEQAADVFTRESDWWWHKGDYEQAIRCNEASILLDPSYVETYTVVAWLEWSMGRESEALGTLHRAIAAAPSDPASYYGLGSHYFTVKKYALAEEPLRKAVALGGDHLMRRTYAHCLERLGKIDAALEQWSALIEERPTDGSVRLNFDRVKRLSQGKRAE